MKKNLPMRLLAMLLCVAMLLPNFSSLAVFADAEEEPLAVLYAGSDFQYTTNPNANDIIVEDRTEGTERMKTILQAIYDAGYTSIDEFLFLGDYEPSEYSDQIYGIEATLEAFSDVWTGTDHDDVLFLQGNHDYYADTLKPYLDGLQETADRTFNTKKNGGYIYTQSRDAYDVVMIHEDAFPESKITDSETVSKVREEIVQETAAALENYLVNTKAGSTKPIIIMSHLPLHYTRQDNIYARYILDAVNTGADAGRNVYFLFAHNHSSSGYDNYLGGSAIYFDAGSMLNVPNIDAAKEDKNASDLVEFKFTYLNAGYVGFYGSKGANEHYGISSTIIEIYEDRIEFTRYNPGGVTNLKAAGWRNESGAATALTPDTSTVASPKSVPFEEITVPADAVPLSTDTSKYAFQLVTDLSTLTTGKNYMILNTDQVGNAVGMSGATDGGVRASGNVLLKTAPNVFALPGADGQTVYTTNTHKYDMWQFETDDASPGGYKMFVSGTRLFLTANNNVFGITGNGTDVANMRMGSSYRSNGTIWWDFPTDGSDVISTMKYGTGDPCTNNMKQAPAGYYLGYNSTGGYFQLSNATSNSPVYFYEQTNTKLSEIKLWVEGNGEILVGSSGDDAVSGAMLGIAVGNDATKIKITADMLSGADLNTAGEQTCSVTYNGVTVKTGFSLNVVEEETDEDEGGNEGGEGGSEGGEVVVPGEGVVLHENLFELITNDADRVDGEQYVIVNRSTAGAGHILDINESNGAYSVVGSAATVFAWDGGIYVQPDENTSIWEIDGHMVSGYRSYLKNTVYTTRYLQANDNGVVDTGEKVTTAGDAMYAQGWRIDSTLAIGGHPERYVVYNSGWSSTAFEWVIPSVSGVSYFYRKSSVDKITASVGDTSGQIIKGNTGTLETGEYITITTTNIDGTYTTKQVPITTDMLGLTNVQLTNYGQYSCSVTYQGKVICEDFTLSVTDEYGNMPEPVTIVDNDLFELVPTYSDFKANQNDQQYIIVNRKTVGDGQVLDVNLNNGTYSFAADNAAVFSANLDGTEKIYVRAQEDTWVWQTKYLTNYVSYLNSAVYTDKYLYVPASDSPVFTMADKGASTNYQYGWVLSESNHTIQGGTGTDDVTIVYEDGIFAPKRRRVDGNKTEYYYGNTYFYRLSEVSSITAYASDTSAALEVGQVGSDGVLPGKYLVVTTTVNGVATTEMVPITAEMLGLTKELLNKAGDYTGKLTYMGKTICEEFPVTVRYAGGVLTQPVDLTDVLGTVYKYSTSPLVDNQEYIIVSSNAAGDAYALAFTIDDNGEYSVTAAPVKVMAVSGTSTLYVQTTDSSWVWMTEASSTSGRYYLKNKGYSDQYLYGYILNADRPFNNVELRVGSASAAKNKLLGWYITSGKLKHDQNQYTNVVNTAGNYVEMDQYINFDNGVFKVTTEYNLPVGDSKGNVYVKDSSATVEAYLDALQGTIAVGEVSNMATGGNVVVVTNVAGVITEENVPITVDMLQGITLTNLHTPGTYTCSVWYEGVKLYDEYKLTVTGEKTEGLKELQGNGKDILGYLVSLDTKTSDDLPIGSVGSVGTGSYLTVYTYMTDGTASLQKIPVTIGMLDKGTVEDYINTPGSHTMNLYFNGHLIAEDYILNLVTTAIKDDYPDFPENGSVRVDKQLDTTESNYLTTGSAQINLSVTGISTTDKANVVIVLDGSSSMTDCVHSDHLGLTCNVTGLKVGTGSNNCPTREKIIKEALENLLNYLNEDINGYKMDIDVSIAYFNQYAAIDPNYKLKDTTTSNAAVDLDDEIMWEFSDIEDAVANIDTIIGNYKLLADTNFDRGMLNAYNLLKEKQIKDYQDYVDGVNAGTITGDYEPRQDFVLFMSDGAPYQYNYISYLQADFDVWEKYLKGTLDEQLSSGDTYASKGYIEEDIEEIFEKFYNTEGKHWMAEAIKGDETQKYKIIDPDTPNADHITYVNGLGATMLTVGLCAGEGLEALKKMASGDEHYYSAFNADEVEAAFTAFGSLVRTAQGANFLDQMGSEFDLNRDNNSTITLNKYELWKNSDDDVTADMIGKRKSTIPTVLEKVTFSGSNAYSTAIGNGSTNILTDGVICGKYFWYNTSSTTAKMIDTNGDGKTETSLPPETFYWSIGGIPEDELVLSYSVYLTGSKEGTRPEGRYPTNNFAYLSYTNYLGNACVLYTTSPELPWGQATVGYAFYLVDPNSGKPIINETTGATGSFENAIKMTQPVYLDLLFNATGNLASETLIANSDEILPDGYTLYDSAAKYTVTMSANGEGSWTISGTNGKTLTTYVTAYGGAPTTDTSATAGANKEYPAYATSSTIVWFAVKADTKAVPDTVIIDFGLPVDINVLVNDVMMTTGNATLVGIGKTETDAGNRAASYTGTYGGASITNNGAANYYDATVRYTLSKDKGMQMKTEETFYYAVNYTGKVGTQGLYYSTVTVVPATTIYYEDNFVSFEVVDANDNDLSGQNWTPVGSYGNKLQDEDRPGGFSLPEIDANNIYGHDSAYASMTQYSMGSAMMVNVNANRTGRAKFTFTGTGFDVISLTSNTTGTIMVRVYKAGTTTLEKALMVDTYYGYKYDGEKWVVDSTALNTLYQVPVIKVEGLTHGTYDVVISASYSRLFDHGQYSDKSYDFYLDAIRIYDPAKGDTEVEGYHKQDSEGWPTYQELRNMLITADEFNSLTSDSSVSGAIFIDGSGTMTADPSIADYTNYGPNNEVYLASGEAIAFKLNALDLEEDVLSAFGTNIASIHLAMKSVGGTATVKVYNAEMAVDQVSAITVSTATDMYYDITDLKNEDVVIYNTSGAILSITNIKVTYTSAPPETANTFSLLTTDSYTGTKALASLMVEEEETVTPTITPTYPTLSFDGEVRYNVYYTMQNDENVALEDMGLITFDSKLYDGTMADAAEVIPGAVTNGTEYMVHTNGIPAKNLGDMVYFKIYVKLADGSYVYSDLMGYNAIYYAEAILGADVDEEMQSLVVAALNYGAEAQKFFGYNTDNLMNAGLTAKQQELVDPYSADMVAPLIGAKSSKAGAFVSNGGFSNQYPTVSFDGAFAINYYFAPSYEADGDITMYIWDQETYNSVEILTAQNASGSEILLPAAMDGEYGARYTGMAAKEIDEIVYVAVVYESNGTTYCSGVIAYSVGYYCMAHAETDSSEMQDLGAATAVYGYYAKQYFN